MKKIFTMLLLLTITLTLSGCKQTPEEDSNLVYTTVYPIEFLVKEIAGNFVDVERVPGSTNAGHSEELHWTGKEIIDMLNADLLFFVDAGLDTYIHNSESVFEDGDVELVNISEEIILHEVCYSHSHDHEDHEDEHEEDEHDHEDEEDHEDPLVDELAMCEENMKSDDPHFWFSPQKMLDVARVVKTKLVEKFPEHASIFEDNFSNLEDDLEELDAGFTMMANEATKPIITSSMLFNYWHSTYEIEVISLSEDAHNSEVVPSEVIHFVEEAVYHDIHYIFTEAYVNSPTADLVLEQLLLEDPTAQIAELYNPVNLSVMNINNEENYLTLMEKNLELLKNATK